MAIIKRIIVFFMAKEVLIIAVIKRILALFIAFVTFILGLLNEKADNVRYKDLSYGNEYIQKMDVYYPERMDETVEAFLLIHRGAWSAGYKEMYSELAGNLAKEGFIAATMNYRKFPQGATYKEMIEDIGAALSALKEKSAADGITVSRVALYGDSAGGHLSLLYAYKYAELSPIPIAFCVGRVAPTDFYDYGLFYGAGKLVTPLVLSQLTGAMITPISMEACRPEIAAASPITFVTEDTLPTILAYGGKDTLVPLSSGVALRELLEVAGVDYAYFEYPNSGHNLDSDLDADIADEFYRTLIEFAAKYF